MELHKLGFKFYARDAEGIDLLKFIPVFHRWIQNRTLADTLLIDVADYTHVPAGPGVLLVAHEGNYGFDETDDRRGVVYYNKRPLPGDLDARLVGVCRKTLQAWKLLADDPEFKDALRIGGELQFFANDRLAAPNTAETYTRLEPALRALLDRLFAGAPYTLERDADPKQRFSVSARADSPFEIDTLLSRLAA